MHAKNAQGRYESLQFSPPSNNVFIPALPSQFLAAVERAVADGDILARIRSSVGRSGGGRARLERPD